MTFKAMLHLMENLPNFNVSNHRNMFIKISSLTISYLNKVFPDPGKETKALMGRLPSFPNLTKSYIKDLWLDKLFNIRRFTFVNSSKMVAHSELP